MTENDYGLSEAAHESMRLLVLSRFEDDALLRQEVETWLDELAHPAFGALCTCEQNGACYCNCDLCLECAALALVLDQAVKSSQDKVEKPRKRRRVKRGRRG